MTLLFIPSLMEGDYRMVMIKLIVVVGAALIIIAASIVDLGTGISASYRLGTKKTTSWGIRQTVKKDLEYLALWFFMFLLDILASGVSDFAPIFKVPAFTLTAAAVIVYIEYKSVKENIKKGKNPEETHIDNIEQLVTDVIEEVGEEKVQKVLSAIKKRNKKKKS